MFKQQLRAAGGPRPSGFTLLQVVIVVAVASVVVTFAVLGVARARASIRLSNSSRVLASYLERARADAVRRRAWTRVSYLGASAYRVEMDLNGDGVMDARDITLEDGVLFTSAWPNVEFNWRGRIDLEVGIGLQNTTGTSGINVSGSGDVTLDSQVFEDGSIPAVTLNSAVSGDLDSTAGIGNVNTSVPYPTPTTNTNANSNSNSNSGTNTNANANTNTNTNTNTNANSNANTNSNSNTNTNTNANANTNTNSNTNANTNTNSNSNTGTQPCSISVSPSSLTIPKQGSKTVTVTFSNMTTTNTLTATVSNSGQLQAAPASKSILGSGTAAFTITVKTQSGSVEFEATPCGVTKTVPVTVTN